MAEVILEIGGNSYPVTCRDGEEDHLIALSQRVDAKAHQAQKAVGGVNEVRQLLLASLLLADELADTANATAQPAPHIQPAVDDEIAQILEQLADQIETLATQVEKPR